MFQLLLYSIQQRFRNELEGEIIDVPCEALQGVVLGIIYSMQGHVIDLEITGACFVSIQYNEPRF